MRYFVTGGSGFVGRHLLLRLLADGHTVRALARSDEAASVVEAHGATAVIGELADLPRLVEQVRGTQVFVHAASLSAPTASATALERTNVAGTARALEAARHAGVSRFVLLSTDEVLNAGSAILGADESWPLPTRWVNDRARTKAAAESLVLAASGRRFHTCAVRPRLVWGVGDTWLLPALTSAALTDRWAWVSGGKHLTSTCHVDNVCEAIAAAASYAAPGQAYFVTDGEPHTYRDFLSRLAMTQGVTLSDRTLTRHTVNRAARAVEAGKRVLRLKSGRTVAEAALTFGGQEFTVVDAKARLELHYAPLVTVEEGLVELVENARGR